MQPPGSISLDTPFSCTTAGPTVYPNHGFVALSILHCRIQIPNEHFCSLLSVTRPLLTHIFYATFRDPRSRGAMNAYRLSLAHAAATRNGETGPSGPCRHAPGAEVPNNGPMTMAVIWSLIGFSAAFLVARISIKHKRARSLWWDDWVLIISWVSPFCT